MDNQQIKNRVKETGSKIRYYRMSKGYTQVHMAGELGISQKTFSKIELCDIPITLDRLFEIARILEINLPDLLG